MLQSTASAVSSQFSDAEEDDLADEDKKPAAKPTRAELMIRKKEAERNRAVMHFKTILAKQERLQADQASEAQKTADHLEECTKELADAKSKLAGTQNCIQFLSTRKKVLDELMVERVSELVKKRKRLHDFKEERSRSGNA